MTAQAIKEPEMYDKSLPLLLADPRIGSLVLAPILGTSGFGLAKGQRILDAVKGAEKPIIMANLGFDGGVSDELVAACHARGIPFFASPERALRAMAYLAHFARALARPKAPEAAVPAGFVASLRNEAPRSGAPALTVTAARDPEWGPTLEIGWAGEWRKALPETIVLAPDLDAAAIAEELMTLAGATLLDGRDLGPVSKTIATLGAALGQDAAMNDVSATLPVV